MFRAISRSAKSSACRRRQRNRDGVAYRMQISRGLNCLCKQLSRGSLRLVVQLSRGRQRLIVQLSRGSLRLVVQLSRGSSACLPKNILNILKGGLRVFGRLWGGMREFFV